MISLGSDMDGGMLSVLDHAGEIATQMFVDFDGFGALAVGDGVMLFEDVDGGGMVIRNADGASVVESYTNSRGRGVHLVSDEQGENRVSMLVDDDGGAFYLANTVGSTVLESYANKEGDGVLILSERDAMTRLELLAGRGKGEARVYDAERIRVIAPEGDSADEPN